MTRGTSQDNNCLIAYNGDMKDKATFLENPNRQKYFVYRYSKCNIVSNFTDTHLIIKFKGYNTICGHEECEILCNRGATMHLMVNINGVVLVDTDGNIRPQSSYFDVEEESPRRYTRQWFSIISLYLNKDRELFLDDYEYITNGMIRTNELHILID